MLSLSSGLFCGGDTEEVCHICAITFPRRLSPSAFVPWAGTMHI